MNKMLMPNTEAYTPAHANMSSRSPNTCLPTGLSSWDQKREATENPFMLGGAFRDTPRGFGANVIICNKAAECLQTK